MPIALPEILRQALNHLLELPDTIPQCPVAGHQALFYADHALYQCGQLPHQVSQRRDHTPGAWMVHGFHADKSAFHRSIPASERAANSLPGRSKGPTN